MLYSISIDTFIYRGFEVEVMHEKQVRVLSGSVNHFYDDISSAIADINKRLDAVNDLKHGDSLTFCANNYTFISYDDQNKVVYVVNDNNVKAEFDVMYLQNNPNIIKRDHLFHNGSIYMYRDIVNDKSYGIKDASQNSSSNDNWQLQFEGNVFFDTFNNIMMLLNRNVNGEI